MADGIKISELEEVEELHDACCFPVVSDGENKKVTKAKLIGNLNGYKTEETVIGKWIDGKPIYRRMFNLSEHTRSDTSVYTPAIDDIDVLVSVKVVAKENDYSGVTGSLRVSYGGECKRDTKKIKPSISVGGIIDYEVFWTIVEYTKTTEE